MGVRYQLSDFFFLNRLQVNILSPLLLNSMWFSFWKFLYSWKNLIVEGKTSTSQDGKDESDDTWIEIFVTENLKRLTELHSNMTCKNKRSCKIIVLNIKLKKLNTWRGNQQMVKMKMTMVINFTTLFLLAMASELARPGGAWQYSLIG